MHVARWGHLAASMSALLLIVGCTAEDSQIVSLRQQLVVGAEPADATTIAVAKDNIAENSNVSIVAQVSTDELAAFVKGQAAFLVTEVCSDEESHCDNDDCAFCNSRKAESLNAVVQFVGKTGDPLAVDARELFGIRPGDIVVIRGKGEVMTAVDMLQVTAKTIFVRPDEEASN